MRTRRSPAAIERRDRLEAVGERNANRTDSWRPRDRRCGGRKAPVRNEPATVRPLHRRALGYILPTHSTKVVPSAAVRHIHPIAPQIGRWSAPVFTWADGRVQRATHGVVAVCHLVAGQGQDGILPSARAPAPAEVEHTPRQRSGGVLELVRMVGAWSSASASVGSRAKWCGSGRTVGARNVIWLPSGR